MGDDAKQPSDSDSVASNCYTPEDLKAAYMEGFDDGASNNNLPYRYPPCCLAWFESHTRRKAGGVITQAIAEVLEQWRKSKFDGREDTEHWEAEAAKVTL
ncbi:MAG: hypothetical protein Fues2KO_45540 [Fuerstiella sp.]